MQNGNLRVEIPPHFVVPSFSIHFFAWGVFWKTRRIASIRFCGKELQNVGADKQSSCNSTGITPESDLRQFHFINSYMDKPMLN